MTNMMTAKEIQSARKAGMVMTLIEGEVQWIGDAKQWKDYENELKEYD